MAMKRNYTRVAFVDKGWQAMLKRMITSDPQVIVGVMDNVADQQHDEDGPATIGEIAAIQEFGAGNIPARPFLRTAVVWGAELAIKRIMAKVARNVVLGTPKNVAIREAGRWAVRRVQATIRSRVFVPNAPSTIERKGNDYTLRESYKLVKSIGFKIVTGLAAAFSGGEGDE
jgi:hypothetical protein